RHRFFSEQSDSDGLLGATTWIRPQRSYRSQFMATPSLIEIGLANAARATIASAATTSNSTTPRCALLQLLLPFGQSGHIGAAPSEPVGGDVERLSVARVFVFIAPRIERNVLAAKVWP